MKRLLFIVILFLSACSNIEKNVPKTTETAPIQQSKQSTGLASANNPIAYIQSDLFEIALIDYHENWLQNIFVVISPKNVNDTSIIRQIIGVLKASYPLDNKSNISFFSEKKYANYKSELFIDGKHLLPMTEYPHWRDNYYLGEYNFETMQYKTFPASSRWAIQKTYSIEPDPKTDSRQLTKQE